MNESSEYQTASKKYWAFISYSSKDKKWGKWLHKRLENYSIPNEYQTLQLDDGTKLGQHIRPVFRDRDELASSSELGSVIEEALTQSRFLIVLCSPNSAASKWVNKEIEDFRAIHGDDNVLALILDGEPNASSNENLNSDLECFPPALRAPLEPLAGDLRPEADGKERGFLKILAGIADIGFDDLYRRHERAQRKRRLIIGTLASGVIAALVGLSIFAFTQKSIAEAQTAIAEKQTQKANDEAQRANEQTILAKQQTKLANEKTIVANEQTEIAKTRLAEQYEESGRRAVLDGRFGEGLLYLHNTKQLRPESTQLSNYMLARTWAPLSPLVANPVPFNSWVRKIEVLPDGTVLAEDGERQIRSWNVHGKQTLDLESSTHTISLAIPSSSALTLSKNGIVPRVQTGPQIPGELWPQKIQLLNHLGVPVSGTVEIPNASIQSVSVLPGNLQVLIEAGISRNTTYSSGHFLLSLLPEVTSTNAAELQLLEGSDSDPAKRFLVNSYIIPSLDGKYLLALDRNDSAKANLMVWSLESGKRMWEKTIEERILNTRMAPGPATRVIATASEFGVIFEKEIRFFQVSTGSETRTVDLPRVRMVSSSKDSAIAFADRDEVFLSLDSGRPERIANFRAQSQITAISFSEDGQRIAIGEEYGHVSLIELNGNLLWQTRLHVAPVGSVSVNMQHDRIAVGYLDGGVKLLSLNHGDVSPRELKLAVTEGMADDKSLRGVFPSGARDYLLAKFVEPTIGFGDKQRRLTPKPDWVTDENNLVIYDGQTLSPVSSLPESTKYLQPEILSEEYITCRSGRNQLIWKRGSDRAPLKVDVGERIRGDGIELSASFQSGKLLTIQRPPPETQQNDRIVVIDVETGVKAVVASVPDEIQLGASTQYWFRWHPDNDKFALASPKGVAIFKRVAVTENSSTQFEVSNCSRWMSNGRPRQFRLRAGWLSFDKHCRFLARDFDGNVWQAEDADVKNELSTIFRNCNSIQGHRQSGRIALALNDGRIIVLSKEHRPLSECLSDSKAAFTYDTKNKRSSVVIGFDSKATVVGGVNTEGKCRIWDVDSGRLMDEIEFKTSVNSGSLNVDTTNGRLILANSIECHIADIPKAQPTKPQRESKLKALRLELSKGAVKRTNNTVSSTND